jgi:hypothetical protein
MIMNAAAGLGLRTPLEDSYAKTINRVTMLARTLRDLLARYCDPHMQCPTLTAHKYVCQNLITG